jgi:hypothetical protein
MNKIINWKIERRKVCDLKPYNKNPRIISDSGKDELRKSFNEIGFAQPININLDNTILSGHARVQVLLEEDPNQEVDVYVPDRMLTPKQEEAVVIRMNKNIAGTWDMEKLRSDFDLNDLLDWGFSDQELEIISNIDGLDVDNYEDVEKIRNSKELKCPQCGFKLHTNG